MCGIAGIVNISGRLSPEQLSDMVRTMADVMSYRGPDDSGVWIDPSGHCALAHRRLSILDTSSAGHQPMLSEDQEHALTFNGEIYNFYDIRRELEDRGEHFTSSSDTEVLIKALRTWDTELLARLDAMYAFGFYQTRARRLMLARDPFGEKPLYYSYVNGIFAFASELHALESLPHLTKELSRDAIAEYLAFQYIPSPRTIYRDIRKLPPGSYLTVDHSGTVHIERFFLFQPAAEPNSRIPLDALAEELEEILIRSIKRRMISDVPLGAFLSGGVDSSTVVALMTKKLGRHVQTFSLGSHGSPSSEHFRARELGKYLGTEHRDIVATPNMPRLVTTVASVLDEPLGDNSCYPAYVLSEFARKHVTVALSGDGGDEMFGGYNRYFDLLRDAATSQDPSWSAANAYFSNRILVFEEPDVRELMGEIPSGAAETFKSFRAMVGGLGENDPVPLLNRMRKVDVDYYMPGAVLPKVDRMSMRHSLEVRCPLLSIEIARFAEKLAPSHCVRNQYREVQGKLVLKELASRYLPRQWLDRRKSGFEVPAQLWDRSQFVGFLRSQVLSPRSILSKVVGASRLRRFVDHQSGVAGYSPYQVWSVALLELWLRQHLVARSQTAFNFKQGPEVARYGGEEQGVSP